MISRAPRAPARNGVSILGVVKGDVRLRCPTYEFAILPGRRSFPGVWNPVEIHR